MIKSFLKRLPGAWPFVVVSALWYLLVAHLSVHWTTNAEYSFGWFGPLVCAYLFLVRWVSRPAAATANSVRVKLLFCLAGFALFPTWLFEQPNPDWRLVSWSLALEVVILTICIVYFLGGKPWVRHFAFSICLILSTVPWPGEMEDAITQGLMRLVTRATVANLHLLGIQAVRHGHLIEVKTGLLGVEAACSGIRSLQATLMVSLLLGELYQASWRRRTALVLCGLLTAFTCNVGRTFLLACIAARNGVDAISEWHDPAGFVILGICFVVVWGFAHLIARTPSGSSPHPHPRRPLSNPLPNKLMAGLAGWLVLTLLGTELWYRAHDGANAVHWSVAWPASEAQFTDIAIPAQEAETLGFDEGSAASWTDGDATRWTGFFFKWAAGPARSRLAARTHRPDVCLPAAGYSLQADRGTITVKTNNLTLPFHALDFKYGAQPVHVFFCLWEDRPDSGASPGLRLRWDRFEGFESVLRGERNLGQQVLELLMFGNATTEQTEAALGRQVNHLLRVWPRPGRG